MHPIYGGQRGNTMINKKQLSVHIMRYKIKPS